MNALLPIIEQLAAAPDHPARAQWLLKCPLSILLKYRATIVNRLMGKGFVDGVCFVEAERAAFHKVRHDGRASNDWLVAMIAIAACGPLDPTEL